MVRVFIRSDHEPRYGEPRVNVRGKCRKSMFFPGKGRSTRNSLGTGVMAALTTFSAVLGRLTRGLKPIHPVSSCDKPIAGLSCLGSDYNVPMRLKG